MTYIAAFRCAEGFVCCADTQETIGDDKDYVEKLSAWGDGRYPFILGGAGVGDIVDALVDEVSTRLLTERPIGVAAVKNTVQAALRWVYKQDVPLLAVSRQERGAQLLIAINAGTHDHNFVLLKTTATRVFVVKEKAIVGWASAHNNALLKRFHRPDMPMSHAVTLAAYLVSQSKATDSGVGGDTSIGIVSQFQSLLEDADFVHLIEGRAREFIEVVDAIFLNLTDLGLTRVGFEEKLSKTVELLRKQRELHIASAEDYIIKQLRQGLFFQPRPYAKIPLGAAVQLREVDGDLKAFIDETQVGIPDHIKAMMEDPKLQELQRKVEEHRQNVTTR